MAANSSLQISQLDFLSIKQNLKDFLRSQATFQDYDFDGSGLDILTDILAYNTHYMGYYLNAVANEMFLDTAQIRASVISHAKSLNYVPTSKVAPTARVNITVTPSAFENTSTAVLTMPKYTRLLSQAIDNVNYPFVTMDTLQVAKDSGAFVFNNVSIKQGEVISRNFAITPENINRRFVIPSEDIDTSTIVVNVQDSVSNSHVDVYSVYDDLNELTPESKVFFIEENPEANGTFTIQFGDGILGRRPSNGSIAIVTYIDTDGSLGNKANSFIVLDTVGGLFDDNVRVTAVNAAGGGAEKETIDQIRFRAPIFYSIQNRAVTTEDYKNLLLKDYPNIETISVWGGEENDPPIYGKIFISLKPREGYYISDITKQEIIDRIIEDRSILTVIPEIIDPEYLYFVVNTTVQYNPNQTTSSEQALAALVRAAILDFSDNTLLNFDSVYRQSRLHRSIDAVDQSILSNSLDVYLQRRVEVDTTQSANYTIEFGTALKNGGFFDKFYTFPSVQIIDGSNVERDVFLEEVTSSFSGISAVEVTNPGRNYTVAPTITISGDGQGATAEAHIVNGRIESIEVIDPGSGYSTATIAISGVGVEAAARASLAIQRATIQSYYYKASGEKIILSPNAGTIYYDLGRIELIDFSPISVTENSRYGENILTFNVKPFSETISGTRNKLMLIDEDDPSSIQVTMVPE